MSDSASAHSAAVRALTDARQSVRAYRFELERAGVPPNQIFVHDPRPDHPQKTAHAAILDYYEEVAQTQYTSRFPDMWQASLQAPGGDKITVDVPSNDVVTKTVDEETGVDNMIPDRGRIETVEEEISLATLGARWSGRSITVKATVDSPYRDADTRVESVRLWLPPKVIKWVYSWLNDCLAKIGLLADTKAPVDYSQDPV